MEMKFKICIDASNIRAGGGVTHLVELLKKASPEEHKFNSVLLYAPSATLDLVENKDWLIKKLSPSVDKSILYRIYWQCFKLASLAKAAKCNILFVPGGSDISGFKPVVSMSQNLLPFDEQQIKRYGFSLFTLKILLLRLTQSFSFKRANGVIFLTEYACKVVLSVTKKITGTTVIIPHGVDPRFILAPRKQIEIKEYTNENPFKVIYVSTIDTYKNQWIVADAVAELRKDNVPVILNLIGSPRSPAIEQLEDCLKKIDPMGDFVNYMGQIPFDKLHDYYKNSELMIFASSCENMPNILLEGMSAGLPIACSNRGPMPEILQDSGIYFDPENVEEIVSALRKIIFSSDLRTEMSRSSFQLAKKFSWKRCADETFSFLSTVAKKTW